MKKIFFGLYLFAAALLSSSCIQNEPLNSECDIEKATVVSDQLESIFSSSYDAERNVSSQDSTIVFYVSSDFSDSTLLESLRLHFEITPGATIWPKEDSLVNLRDQKLVYTVTSEDGLWHRTYSVRIMHNPPPQTDLTFEHFRLEGRNRYEEWFEYTEDGIVNNQWASGNPGFAISRSSAKLEEYPTISYTDDAVQGHSVKLETRDTGRFGEMVNMRIAAGNLFVGTFDVANALKDAMAATRFGLPFNKKPLRFEGYYKFKPGEQFQNKKGTVIEDRTDEPDLYAVLYKNHDEQGRPFTLQGDNVLTHPNIVALARVTDRKSVGKDGDLTATPWTYFDIPFEYGEEIDQDLLKNFGYNLTVVFTSSIEGASFCGAVGSTLLVDEVKVVCEE